MRLVLTTREGGVSEPPFDSFNLGRHVGDDPTAVAENRRRLAASFGAPHVVFMEQAHGAVVAVADAATPDDVAGVDALVTAAPGVPIAVLVADCVPLVLSGDHAVAVVHAGRRGVEKGVVAAAVAALRNLDDGPLSAFVGPSVCGRCYEVPAEMQASVSSVVPEALSTTRAGTPGLDLAAAVCAQLRQAGVEARVSRVCTREDPTYFSYRRDGVTGRFAAAVMLEA